MDNYNNDSWNNPQGNGSDPQQNNYSNQCYQQPYGTDNNQDYQQSYGANDYQQPYGSQPDYNNYNQTPSYQQPNYNNMSNAEEHVSVLHWIGIFCLNIIPCVGPIVYIVMMFIWAFGSTPKKSLKNFARAQLILFAIALGIMLIIVIISLVTGAAILSSASSYSSYY